jgi:dienelactone hydrolase
MRPHLLLALLFATPAAAETPAALIRLAEPAGLARLVRPAGAGPVPLVVILPDALGDDGRAEPYVDSLLARGIASLALGLDDDAEAAAPAAVAPALDWARAAGFAPARIGLLGFGLGARAALGGAAGLPAVALYPGCAALHATTGPALVLQGADAAAGCGAVIASAGLALELIPGAGHGWDAPGALWPSPGPLLRDPAGGPRLAARADHAVTLHAAEMAAAWFAAQLAPPSAGAARIEVRSAAR